MNTMNGGRVARTAGLIITTSLATAAIQNTTWSDTSQAALTLACIVIGAFLGAMAADYDGVKQ